MTNFKKYIILVKCVLCMSLMSSSLGYGADTNWTGFYMGISGGYADGVSNAKSTVADPANQYFTNASINSINGLPNNQLNGGNGIFGINAGYNWQSSNQVFGLLSEISSLNFKKSNTQTTKYPCCTETYSLTNEIKSQWLMTVEGKYGIALNQSLIFLTAGVAATNLQLTNNFSDKFDMSQQSSVSALKFAPAIGFGYEQQFADNWAMNLRYQYIKFSNISNQASGLVYAGDGVTYDPRTTFQSSADLKLNILKIGITKHF